MNALGIGFVAGVCVVMFSACGGATVSAPTPPLPGFWTSAPDAPLSRMHSEALAVPEGYARKGTWLYDPRDNTLAPAPCDPNIAVNSVRVRVRAFRLTKFEVTNEEVYACLADGRCPRGEGLEPLVQASTSPKSPAALGLWAAQRFCRLQGGDLPTREQWIRAASGDNETFAEPRLMRMYLDCLRAPAGAPQCSAFVAAIPPSGKSFDAVDAPLLLPVDDASAAWDAGPYGHRGMFGGAAEWPRPATLGFDRLCFDADADQGDADALYVPERSGPYTADSAEVMHVAYDLAVAGLAPPGVGYGTTSNFARTRHGRLVVTLERPSPSVGFRCAFRPED